MYYSSRFTSRVWLQIEGHATSHLDMDGDGRVGRDDVMHWVNRGWDIIKMQGPGAVGFGLGVAVGLRL